MRPPTTLSGKEIEVRCAFNLAKRTVERVGLGYLIAKKKNHGTHIEHSSGSTDKLNEEDDIQIEVDVEYLRSLNPKEWKDQDHYAVLGLEKQRINASEDDIRRAYRRMVLLHHPDKRKAKGEEVDTDKDYFTCITKAYEILGTTKTRRAYDSVDPEFDDNLPTQSEIDKNYFEVFNKYFQLNARWSERKDVPPFGDSNAERADVDRFYTFWYDFKSWREFSYLDEEDKEKGQDRDERRWIEKENKAARIKRKKEEMQRIRSLVDLAYNNDKRIQRFKNEEKEKKLAAKRAKMDAAQAQKAEAERVLREAQLAKERADKAEQKRIEAIRIEKEQLKKAVKKERKALRDKAKEFKYFCPPDNDKNLIKNMEGVEKICESYSLAELQELNKRMAEASNRQVATDLFNVTLKAVDKKLEAANENAATEANKKNAAATAVVKEVKRSDMWTNQNVQLLIKAVNLFPAGTSQRWDVIASFINQHSSDEGGSNVSARDVLNKAKALQNSDFSKSSLKTAANQAAFESFEKSNKKDVQRCQDITVNDDMSTKENDATVNNKKAQGTAAPPLMNGLSGGGEAAAKKADSVEREASTAKANNTSNNNSNSNNNATATAEKAASAKSSSASAAAKQWTKEEQALLEQAIKTFPINTPDRWDRIAECIPNRTKKDCMRRVKELVELVSSKNKAQQAVK